MTGDAHQVACDRSARQILAAALLQHRQERLLHDVVAGIGPAHVDGISTDGALMPLEQLGEGPLVAPPRPVEQTGLLHLTDGVLARRRKVPGEGRGWNAQVSLLVRR